MPHTRRWLRGNYDQVREIVKQILYPLGRRGVRLWFLNFREWKCEGPLFNDYKSVQGVEVKGLIGGEGRNRDDFLLIGHSARPRKAGA